MADDPAKDETILKQEVVLPLLPKEEVTPAKEDVSVPAEEVKAEVPLAKEETPLPNADIPSVKVDVPSVEEDIPSIKEDGASAKEDVSSTKEDVPLVKEDVYSAKEDVPSAKEDVPSAKEDVPSKKEDAKEDIPVANEGPKVNLSTAKEDISSGKLEPLSKKEDPIADVASDPEEDDLSDLDDVLDEFAATKAESKAPAPAPPVPASGPERPPPEELLATDQDEFAKQLQAEMEQLLGQEDFKKQFEDIMKEMGDVLPPPSASDTKEEAGIPAKASASADKSEKSFQDTIRKTMERMQESGEQASAAAASSDSDDILAQMLKEMESGGFGGEGSDEDFSKILMGMMEQLTNREVLYEPMKELNDKYPAWMEENKTKVPADDLKRYEEQRTLVREIVSRFERKGYSDDNTQDREYIVERMQKMQAAGSPPPDLVGEMNAAQEALSEIDQGCPTQ